MGTCVGIMGAGQLGKMLAEAMTDMGIEFVLYDSQSDACGRTVGPMINAAFDDRKGIDELVARADVITCEFENVPVSSLKYIEQTSSMLPPSRAFVIASNRLSEKELFRQLAIDCVQNQAVDSFEDLVVATDKLGFPLVLKTCSGGYDGKGQLVIHKDDNLRSCYESFINLPCIAEQYIDFVEEVSCILVRNASGATRSYPLSRNIHKDGILRISYGCTEHPLERTAIAHTRAIAEHLGYIGVITLECFVTGDGKLLANEIAPRVHNSGHWTIEGAATSQFKNHIRALLDLPLGETNMGNPAAMVNLLGCMPNIQSDERTFVHAYGKQIKPKRKVGHITLIESDQARLETRVSELHRQIYAVELP